MNSLKEIYNKLCKQGYETDKGSIHSYIDVYEEILKPYCERAKNVLEIGVFKGNSLRMWTKYFSGTVYGVDCDIKPHGGMADLTDMVNSEQWNIKIFDATNPELVKENFGDIKFDVIIEDAGHHIEQQVELYNIYKEYLSESGIYIIEDVQDIDATKNIFENLDNSKKISIFDLRNKKGRYDDVLIIIQ
jgi:spermidine synthase